MFGQPKPEGQRNERNGASGKTVITGAATSAADPAVAAPARAELLESIVGEARRLERMLANLLQLTRVETGIVPTREWVPLDELIGGALTRLEPLLGERAVTVAVGDVEVEVDPVLFELALVNLIENAIKHGAPPIELAARRRGDRIELDVRDHGPGLPAGAERAVFDKFVRVPGTRAPGVGLGLAICRGVVAAHGGTITVEPAAGGGARFHIVLPAPPPPPPPALEPDEQPGPDRAKVEP